MPGSNSLMLNSWLNRFLYAEVGVQLNGLPLTILSILARLEKDPWAEAANWAQLPRSEAINRLTESIYQMPLCTEALLNAPFIASRLTLLLPTPGQLATPCVQDVTEAIAKTSKVKTLFYVLIVLGLALNIILIAAHPTQFTDSFVAAQRLAVAEHDRSPTEIMPFWLY